jgi:hypothetical protein
LAEVSLSKWNTDFAKDPQRAQYHAKKMQSKDERPAKQLTFITKKKDGVVYHMPQTEFEQY